MNNRIYTHSTGSRSSTLLKTLMGTRHLNQNRPASNVVNFINWGNGVTPEWDNQHLRWLNHPTLVGKHTNKLSFFSQIASQSRDLFLEYTTSADVARSVLSTGHRLYQRATLNGHGGEGIQVISSPDELNTSCRLWTLAENISREFRVIAVKGETPPVLNIQEKKKVDGWRELGNFSNDIRSEHTGWAFCEYGEEEELADSPLVHASLSQLVGQYFQLENSLDFGGFDIALLENGEYRIIEVNTAPGLGDVNGQLLADYFNHWSGVPTQGREDVISLLRGQ